MNNILSGIQSFLEKYLGFDRALFYSLFTRIWQITSGVITVLLLVHYMVPVQQGFYYTFSSVLNLQLFFELGLSFVILQTTSHYFVDLQWEAQGKVVGPEATLQRFLFFLRKSIFWYLLAAIGFVIFLIPGGLLFFSLRANNAQAFAWKLPWVLVVVGTAVSLITTPLLAAIEGSGRVAEVYRFKTEQFILANVLTWIVLIFHGGLYIAASLIWIESFFAGYWLFAKKRDLLMMLWERRAEWIDFSWFKEIWPMQWRIAVSWASGYLINQIFVPLLFYYQGPIVSGQMGLSIMMINMLNAVSITWVTVKSPLMGALIAKKSWEELDQKFKNIFLQSAGVYLLGSLCILVGMWIFKNFTVIHRILPVSQIALLLASGLCVQIIGSLALYLRGHRKDPLMLLSVIGAVLVTAVSWAIARPFGSLGMCWGFLIVNIIYGLPSGIILWVTLRNRWHAE